MKFKPGQTIYHRGTPTKVLGAVYNESECEEYYFVEPTHTLDDETFSVDQYPLWTKAEKLEVDLSTPCDYICSKFLLAEPMRYNKGDIVRWNGLDQKVINHYGNDGEQYYHLDQTNHVVPLEKISARND